MDEIIKAVIATEETDDKTGMDILVRCIKTPTAITKNTLVKKDYVITDGNKKYGKHRGFNLSDLLIIKKNWGKILGAMSK